MRDDANLPSGGQSPFGGERAPAGSRFPPSYVGLWRRLPDAAPTSPGSAVQAYWMQTSSLYAQLRIPASRPAVSGIRRLEELSDEQLAWLARQEGFAGRAVFEAGQLRRERTISFQPPKGPDEARIYLASGLLVEQGEGGSYVEEWQSIGDCATDDLAALELIEDCGAPGLAPARAGFLLVLGDYFMYAMDRRPELPAGDLATLVRQAPDHNARVGLLDCEIAFGRRRGAEPAWQIQWSTLPFHEGRSLFEQEPRPILRPDGTCEQVFAQGVRRWAVREWSPGLHWNG